MKVVLTETERHCPRITLLELLHHQRVSDPSMCARHAYSACAEMLWSRSEIVSKRDKQKGKGECDVVVHQVSLFSLAAQRSCESKWRGSGAHTHA